MSTNHFSLRYILMILITLIFSRGVFADTLSKSTNDSEILGFYPYMKSIGTLMYRSPEEGNRGAFDEHGRRIPTVGSIIGFYDNSCGQITKNVEQNTSSSKVNTQWEKFFSYDDFDEDACSTSTDHIVEWFIIDTPDISLIKSWEEIENVAISINKRYPEAIIPANSTASTESTSFNTNNEIPNEIPLSGKFTTAVKIPEAALGKYIGVTYTPKSEIGQPRDGKPIKIWDLNYFYEQLPPSNPGIVLNNPNSLATVQGEKNTIKQGTGGGKVQPNPERPRIDNISISGIYSPGQTLEITYDFYPFPDTFPSLISDIYDHSVYVWGDSEESRYVANQYDETLTLEENKAALSELVTLTQSKTLVLSLDDIGHVAEFSILPLRRSEQDAIPIAGNIKTHKLDEFEEKIEPLVRPQVSNIKLTDWPLIGEPIFATYRYTPSNSTKSYDASYYKWSYTINQEEEGAEEVVLKEGYIVTDPTNIPDYDNPVPAPDSGPIDIERNSLRLDVDNQEGIVGNVIKLRIEAFDGFGLKGNWAEKDTNLYGEENDMFGIRLVQYNYGGSFPIIPQYGRGYPTTGFAGANFRLFAENFNITTNRQNWTWKVVQNEKSASVDETGMVTLLKIPPRNSVVRITATNKADPTIVRNHSFTINKWLLTFDELSKGIKTYNFLNAEALCRDFRREDVANAVLPTIEDLTSVTVDPRNDLRSKGANGSSEGRKTIYNFPSNDFYSQWGNLIYYRTPNLVSGGITTTRSFRNSGRYMWTRDTHQRTGQAMYAGNVGYGDWLATPNSNMMLNAACIIYSDNFMPEEPDYIEGPMAGIKLTNNVYTNRNVGIPTEHKYGEGFPTIGFNGAIFNLFAEDKPGTSYFNSNNISRNRQWSWKVDGGEIATNTQPSKNEYVSVSYQGQVILLKKPPRNKVIKITAVNGQHRKTHSFTLDKWVISFRELNNGGGARTFTLLEAQKMCHDFKRDDIKQAYLPSLADLTAIPVDPANDLRSKGAGSSQGYAQVYKFPSSDLYSQWGRLDDYRIADVNTGKLTGITSFVRSGSYQWSRDSHPRIGQGIHTGNSIYGDWFANPNSNQKLNAACIVYLDERVPSTPELMKDHMAGIKLTYNGYPKTQIGFNPEHEHGKGFPNVGFNGATFNLFAEDKPGMSYFNSNNLSNNRQWSWKINGGEFATSTQPSKNAYASVSYEGQVILFAKPPKDYVIEVTALNSIQLKKHTFTIDKWMLNYQELSGGAKTYNLLDAKNLCHNYKKEGLGQAFLPSVLDLTSVPADPENDLQSKGAGGSAEGFSTIYTYPSTDFYSQWGRLDNYRAASPETGKHLSMNAFPRSGYYQWTRSHHEKTGKPIYTSNGAYGDWFSTPNSNQLLNTSCVVYSNGFVPEQPPYKEALMAGIKLTNNSYPKTQIGFPTKYELGKGFPSVGFNGAAFNLFAEDEPGSDRFNSNNITNNRNWTWQVEGGQIAKPNFPSFNKYVSVTSDGLVVLLAKPPKGHILKVTAISGAQRRTHTFSINKWLLNYQELSGGARGYTFTQAQNLCANFKREGYEQAQLPNRLDMTTVPVDPENDLQSLGANNSAEGYNTVYNFPSGDYFSQWGNLDNYKLADPLTGKLLSPNAFQKSGNYLWTKSKHATTKQPIYTGNNAFGDWFVSTNPEQLTNAACIIYQTGKTRSQ
ncbi:hypothetical protein [Thorsellia kenyensis]|uniref:Uncharacterized protein n=1 Tax=Thorsellia kenyensis TaxID=1549888 RepID=A0ABV6C6Z9_9GAMM